MDFVTEAKVMTAFPLLSATADRNGPTLVTPTLLFQVAWRLGRTILD